MDGGPVGVIDAPVLFCAQCRGERAFEQPPCADGHETCPEWACVACGSAVLLDPAGAEGPRAGADVPAGSRPAGARPTEPGRRAHAA